MTLMIPQAASVLGCERLWLNITATLFFLSFHAGSHLTIGVASWTWSTFAVALDLKKACDEILHRFLFGSKFGSKNGAIQDFTAAQIHCTCQHFQTLQHVRVVFGGVFSPPRAYNYYYYYYYQYHYHYHYHYHCVVAG